MEVLDIILLIVAISILGGLGAIIWLYVRPKFKQDGSVESSMIKRHAIIHHDTYGSLIWVGFKPLAANFSYGLVQAVTEEGSPREWPAYEEEIIPINNVTNAMGDHAVYRYTPIESRTAAIRENVASKHSHAATAAHAMKEATKAKSKAAVLEANESQRVSEQLDNIGKVVKAATPKKAKGET
jgi:hypothetical protein